MGAAKNNRQNFLKVHKKCAFCGGKADATTIEHCPPRAMFQFRHWPEGFQFPACEQCNQGTDDDDLLVAILARMGPRGDNGDRDGHLVGLMKMANGQFPGLFEQMMPTAMEARHLNRELGRQPAVGRTHQEEACFFKVPETMHLAVCVFARKLAKAIFYREAGVPFPDEGCLLLNWFTNEDLVRTGKYIVFDLLKDLGGAAPPLKRSGRYLNDQFEYKVSLSSSEDMFALQARFGAMFGLVVFGRTLSGALEDTLTRLRDQEGRDGAFTVLQSPSTV